MFELCGSGLIACALQLEAEWFNFGAEAVKLLPARIATSVSAGFVRSGGAQF